MLFFDARRCHGKVGLKRIQKVEYEIIDKQQMNAYE